MINLADFFSVTRNLAIKLAGQKIFLNMRFSEGLNFGSC